MELDISFLNDIEKAEVVRFADNPTMMEAVKKMILHSVYFQGVLREGEPANPTLNFGLQLVAGQAGMKTNEEVGAQLRARWEGVNFVESGFQEISRMKTPTSGKPIGKNPAR